MNSQVEIIATLNPLSESLEEYPYEYETYSSSSINEERQSLKDKVCELGKSACKENWDGEGAAPVKQSVIDIAYKIIDELPNLSILYRPDISVTPHGEIDFDWVVNQDTMLTISIGISDEIAIACIVDEEHSHDSEKWAGKLPFLVNKFITRLYNI